MTLYDWFTLVLGAAGCSALFLLLIEKDVR